MYRVPRTRMHSESNNNVPLAQNQLQHIMLEPFDQFSIFEHFDALWLQEFDERASVIVRDELEANEAAALVHRQFEAASPLWHFTPHFKTRAGLERKILPPPRLQTDCGSRSSGMWTNIFIEGEQSSTSSFSSSLKMNPRSPFNISIVCSKSKEVHLMYFRPQPILFLSLAPSEGSWPSAASWARPH